MQHNYASPIVIKYGGAALDEGRTGASDPILDELVTLAGQGEAAILVHGGGPEIDRALEERGASTERIDGQRVTDAATLEVVEAVLCGTINKRLVRASLERGLRAIGVSGQDGAMLVAERACARAADLGFVGEIVACEISLLSALLGAHLLPIIAPLAVSRDGAQAYNVNADLAAAAIAAALHARAFVVVTNVPRVLRNPDDPSSGIERMAPQEARRFAASDACRSSMKPKMLAAASAVDGGAAASYICDAKPGAVARALAGDATIISA